MTRTQARTYYEILQVNPRASREVIQGAYRALLKAGGFHPDLGGSDEEAKIINEAYSVLADPTRRREYDQQIAQASSPGPAGEQALVRTQYILICPSCRQKNLLTDLGTLGRTKCAACGHVLEPKRRMPVETDHGKAFRMGIFLYDKGMMQRARKELETAVRLNPRNSKYHYWLGRCNYQMRVYEQSRQAFHRATQLRPEKFHFQFWLGQTCYVLQDYQHAVEGFNSALKIRPEHNPTRLRLASCFFRLGRYPQAVKVLEEAIRRDPGQLELYTLMGVVYLAGRNPEAALKAFQRVESLHPGDSTARKYIDIISNK
ncbi:MAG: tetratricopeptide repeat protein [Deltaproteobacteria bacterium]|nr:tetratricopeptide repeat protein [Deltaproteobacteria bacterium]